MATTAITSASPRPHFQQHRPSARGEPVWDIARLYPAQGYWTEEDYLSLDTNHLVELSDGFLEVLPMPTWWHQRIVRSMYHQLLDHVTARRLGDVVFAPLPVHLRPDKYREPDLLFLNQVRLAAMGDYPSGADLALEVVSEGRGSAIWRRSGVEHAAAGIPEYWIIDPELREITVLTLVGDEYRVHGVFRDEEMATSVLLAGFAVRASGVFSAGENPIPN